MSDQQPVSVERRSGLLALTPYATIAGVLALIYLYVMRGRQTEDGPLDLYTTLIALAVGLTVFCGLWWTITSRGGRDLAAWWNADDPTAHVHLPIWGTATCVILIYLLFFTWFEARIGAFGLVFFTIVLQVAVLNIVGRHLARRLDRDMSEVDVASTLKWAMSIVGWPFILLLIMSFITEVPVLTSSVGGDIALSIFVLAPLMLALLYVGFAVVYGAGQAFEQTWYALFPRQAGGGAA
jgi:hypothetical protein